MPKSYKKIVFYCGLVALSMFCFCFAMVPVYKKLCQFTGLNTAYRIEAFPDFNRGLTVQFLAQNNLNLPWNFFPKENILKIHPEELVKIVYVAKNNSDHTITVRAIPSITPGLATKYFHKIECFCFTRQTLAAGQQTEWPLVFIVDKNIPDNLKTITLAYTIFDVTDAKSKRSV